MLSSDLSYVQFSSNITYQEAHTINQICGEILVENYSNYATLTTIFDSIAFKQHLSTESALKSFTQNLYAHCMPLANANDSHALVLQALFYSFGIGCKRSYQNAIVCLNKSIALNNTYAMHTRAYIYKEGLAGKANYPEAIRLYELAIKGGNTDAMNNRACMHEAGQGGPVNYPEAIRLYKLAIKGGNTNAIVNLAYMYETGQGVPRNYSEAIDLYELAIKQGNATAMHNRAYMHHHGRGGKINKAQAIYLYECALRKGQMAAKECLNSIKIDKDLAKQLVDILWDDLIHGGSFTQSTIFALGQYCKKEIVNRIKNSPQGTSILFLKNLLKEESTHPLALILKVKPKEKSLTKKAAKQLVSIFHTPTSPLQSLEKQADDLRKTGVTFFALCRHKNSSLHGLAPDLQKMILSMAQPGAKDDITYQSRISVN
ncbi:TPR repeat protein, SEL1 subfamily [Legionella busanensis]|uniref:TPR repeat protein, SEL1 subfamily n=1 Tax=Legionella busanensis TaxID=190655 RepID=A0A378JTG1_9GAMM|nr:tetratricopeptide repeat protein [Legionella busanensis]STX51462.1 TPR repeat protein, SEL1 subfamily [Legionella busanensis]